MEREQKGRALYVVLALAFAALIVGGATWFYVTGQPAATETAQTETTDTNTETATSDDAESEFDTSVADLDSELAVIEVDEESNDDTVDF